MMTRVFDKNSKARCLMFGKRREQDVDPAHLQKHGKLLND